MGYKEINVFRDIRQRFQIGPGRDAVELDSIEFDFPVLQIHYPTRNKVSGARGFLIKDAVVIPRNEDSELGRYGIIPAEEVLQIGRIKALTGISGAD